MATVQFCKIPTLSEKQTRRFWGRVRIGPESECWPWIGRKNTLGYGVITLVTPHSRSYRANRIAYFLKTGQDPGQDCVLHRCDNPPCCNPSHLFLGTYKDNFEDMRSKGRMQGLRSLNGRQRLTAEQVLQIRQAQLSRTVTQKTIAAKYGVSWRTIEHIRRREIWRHLP